jgi:hypothetical protein
VRLRYREKLLPKNVERYFMVSVAFLFSGGDVMMKKENGLAWFNIIFGALLYIGAFYVSYAHTLEFMHRADYVNQYAHIITLVGEGVFILGMVNLIVLQIKGKKIAFFAAPRLALWTGLIIVGYSNWSSGLGKGAEAIAVGIGIVVVMWVAESVMSYGIKETRSNKHQTEDLSPTQKEINENLKNESQSQITLTPVFEASKQTTNSYETSNTTHKKSNEVSHKFEDSQKPSDEASNKFEDSHTKIDEVSKPQISSHQSSPVSKINEENNHTSQLKNEESQISSIEFEGSPEEFARDYLDRNDKLPTIKLIKEKTGATDWTARQARSNLKKSIEKAS